MARYVVERTYPDGLRIPTTEEGSSACLGLVDKNADVGVTWVLLYATEDKGFNHRVYDGPR